MIRYLIDSSALWRILRDEDLRTAWTDVASVNAIGSCEPQRIEIGEIERDDGEIEIAAAQKTYRLCLRPPIPGSGRAPERYNLVDRPLTLI